MRWRRRRPEPPRLEIVPAPRVERALVALAVHAQQLDDRIGRLERRLDASVDAVLDLPTHDDVMDVRMHSARVAAELSRMVVELRAEIDQAVTTPAPTSARQRRVHAVAETIVDMADRVDTLPSDLGDTTPGRAATA